jgi:hypothetical protein
LSDVDRQRLEADLTAKFINWTITASAGTGGVISPSGAVSVSPGANQAFVIAPLTGYALTNVTVDGVLQGTISSYTFTNRAFGWQLKKADRQRGKEIARQQPSKRLEYAGEEV